MIINEKSQTLVGKTLIRASNLTKINDQGHKILDDINFEIFEGQYIFFIGQTGAGKTSLLRALFGFDTDIEGKIHSVLDSNEIVPMLSQTTAKLIGHLSFEENTKLLKSPSDNIERWNFLLELFDIRALIEERIDSLSVGTQQKLELALTLFLAERIVIIDEALTNLSLKLSLEIFAKLRKYLTKHNLTIVQTTHDHQIAFHCADRVVVIQDGKIVADGLPEEVFYHPTNLFVFNFIGRESTEKNNITGTIQLVDDVFVFQAQEIRLPLECLTNMSEYVLIPNTSGVLACNADTIDVVEASEPCDFIATVTKIDFLSNGLQRLQTNVGHQEIISHVGRPSRIFQKNETVGLRLDPRHTYLFLRHG